MKRAKEKKQNDTKEKRMVFVLKRERSGWKSKRVIS